MSIEMSIANTAMKMSEMKVQQAVNIEMIKKAMEVQELELAALIGKLPDVSASHGGIIDVKA